MKFLSKIVNTVVTFFALIFSGCDHGHHCGDSCCCHRKALISLKKDAIYKVVAAEDFNKEKTDNCVDLSPLDKQSGFMHASYASQVVGVLNKFFADSHEVVILELDCDVLKELGTEMKAEVNRPGGSVFPHLHGVQKIPITAVKMVKKCIKNNENQWEEKV